MPILKTEAGEKIPYLYFLLWLVLFNLILFSGFVMHDLGYTDKVLAADQSYITLLITAVFLCASIYCAIHIFKSSKNLIRAEEFIKSLHLDDATKPKAKPAASQVNDLIDNYIKELSNHYKTQEQGQVSEDQFSQDKSSQGQTSEVKTSNGINQANYILEIYVDEARSSGEILQFIIDVLIRLGLIGTIIGFILMLQSFVSGPNPSAENIQELLITMSSGMGTALYTTFAGLIASTLLGIQQIFLNKNVEQIIASLIRLSDRSSITCLSNALNGASNGNKQALKRKEV